MDWHMTDFTLVGPIMFAGDKWLGEFSSFDAAREGIRFMRDGGFANLPVPMLDIAGRMPTYPVETEATSRARLVLTDADFELLAAIDHDED